MIAIFLHDTMTKAPSMLINSLITLTIVFSFLQFFLGETPRFQRLLTITVHVGNQPIQFFSFGTHVGAGVSAGNTERTTRGLLRQRLNITINFNFFNFGNIAVITK